MVLDSIDSSCSLEYTSAPLRTEDKSELTWDYFATTLIDEHSTKLPVASSSCKKSRSSRWRNRGRAHPGSRKETMSSSGGDSGDSPHLDPTVRAFALTLKSVNSTGTEPNNPHGDLCDKAGHFANPETPNNRLPGKVRRVLSHQSSRAKVAAP